jgi:hypothetical protein
MSRRLRSQSWPALAILGGLLVWPGCEQGAVRTPQDRKLAGQKADVLIDSDPPEAVIRPKTENTREDSLAIEPEWLDAANRPTLPPDDLDGVTRPPLRTPGEDPPPDWVPGQYAAADAAALAELEKPLDPPPEAKGLSRVPDLDKKGSFYDVWVDKDHKRIVMAGRIVKREGPMELFACLRRTKEHESIVSVRTKAFAVHAFLMALGCSPGRPVKFQPTYEPATGPEVEITVHWTDEKGARRTARAQEWLLNEATGKASEHPWVFAGSMFWDDPDGKRYYLAEDGDFICVSNFQSAMLDLPIKSSQANRELMFSAFTDRIPPVGTQIAVILTPKRAKGPLEAPSPGKGTRPAAEAPAEKPATPAARGPLSAPNAPRGTSALPAPFVKPRAGALPLYAAPDQSGEEAIDPRVAPARPAASSSSLPAVRPPVVAPAVRSGRRATSRGPLRAPPPRHLGVILANLS